MNGLKEWATVVKALEHGKQTVILRKGGILETASGFRVESKKFLLFPTWEHQETKHVKPEYHNFLNETLNCKPKHGYNTITSLAEVLDEKDITSKNVINRLSSFHVWSDEYITERMNWMPKKPIKAIFIRVYKVSQIDIPLEEVVPVVPVVTNLPEPVSKLVKISPIFLLLSPIYYKEFIFHIINGR